MKESLRSGAGFAARPNSSVASVREARKRFAQAAGLRLHIVTVGQARYSEKLGFEGLGGKDLDELALDTRLRMVHRDAVLGRFQALI